MSRRLASLFIHCLFPLMCALPARADGIQLTSFQDNETIRYPVPFLQGTLDDKTARTVTVINKTSTRPTKELKGIAHKGRFKAFAELVPGANQLVLRAGSKELAVTLNYKPQKNPYVVQAIYLTDDTGNTKYQTPRQNDAQNFRAKIDTEMKVLQSFTADRMNSLGYGRLTFNLEFDKNGRVDVHTMEAAHPAAYYYALGDVEAFLAERSEVEKRFNSPRTKKAVHVAFTRYDPAARKLLAGFARGGGGAAINGTYSMWSWPASLGDVFSAFSDRSLVNTQRVGDDSDGRGTIWGQNATSFAVMLHELMHTWELPHSKDPVDVIGGRGFRNVNRYYTFVEPPSKQNARSSEPPEDQASYIAPISGSSLKNSRWFALDDKPWKDGNRPRITLSGTAGDILIEAEHGLGYVGIDVQGDAVAFKTWGPPDRDPPQRYLLTAAELKELAGTTDVRIRADDVQGQHTDVETKNLKK
jgi:hypothetical protein